MERFDAPWDRSLKVSTGFLLLLLLGLAGGFLAFDVRLSPDPQAIRWGLLLGPLLIALVIPGVWVLAPRGYSISGGELTVERPLFPIRIPLASIRAVRLMARAEAGTFVKVAGAAGAFGHYGRFYSRPLGSFRLYATRRDQLVVIDAEAGRFVLTPATPERFIEALGRAGVTAAATVSPAGAGLAAAPGAPWKLLLVLFASVPLLVGAILGSAWYRAPFAATVEADAIRIDHRWGDPERIPLAEVRAVAPLPVAQSHGWRRINGVGGLGGASYGRFHSDQLGPFMLHAWRSGPYVLLTTGRGPVVLTPDDPAAFVSEVGSRLSP